MKSVVFVPPDQAFSRLWLKIPNNIKIAFIATFMAGILVHAYMFTNLFMNHDGLSNFVRNFILEDGMRGIHRTMYVGGRWFQPVAHTISGFIPAPWILGIISIFYLSITTCLIIACLEIKSKYGSILTGILMVTFPSVGMLFAYLYIADTVLLSLLLACLAVYITKKYKMGFIFGGILLALSLGIYQAYITFAVGLFIIILVLDTLKNEENSKVILIRGVKYFTCLVIGLAIYFIITFFSLRILGIELIAYMGMDQMGQTPLYRYPEMITTAYREFFHFFTNNPYNLGFIPYRLQIFSRLANILPLFLIPTMILLVAIKKAKSGEIDQQNEVKDISSDYSRAQLRGNSTIRDSMSNTSRILLLILFVALMPLAINSIHISGSTGIHMLMQYGLVLTYVFIIALMEQLSLLLKCLCTTMIRRIGTAVCWISLAILVMIPYNYFLITNDGYLRADLSIRQASHFSSVLMHHIRETPGFIEGMHIVLVGERSDFDDIVMNLLETERQHTMQWGTWPFSTNVIINTFRSGQFLRIYTGERVVSIWGVARPSEFFDPYREELSELSIFPAEGSTIIIDGILFIRMGEEF